MPYAAYGLISQEQIDGGLLITEAQYAEALAGMLEGKVVTVDGGFKVEFPPVPEPEVPTEPPPVTVVSRFQALAALMQAGLLDDVTAWANAPTTDPLYKLAFDTATEFSISSPTMTAGAAALGWSGAQLQALFDAAAEIVA
ncbi:hypothetical protein [Achromobacter xylosoxidans]|uniref:Uncharacterized protein n=1 Tax=Alcaligenes xylosoxydans xylosoxydans TaxID=85698 RepID=A0A0X8NXR1_ALCXX|nr:hypothetical protein [Achromobacter xylosoxidans]AMG36241.1 hypothetical protein AL504_09485 [Achromobacter xylosoxidans]